MYFTKFNFLIKKYPVLKYVFYPAIVVRRSVLNKRRALQEQIFNNLSKLLVEDPIIRVDEFEGNFAIDSRSDLFRRFVIQQQYEAELVKQCMALLDVNRDVIDVGANIGFFSVLFAQHLDHKKVLSIEPTKCALYRLYKNLALNNVQDRVIVFEGVASNFIGNTEIKTIQGKEEYSSLGEMKHPSILHETFSLEKIASTTLDELTKQYSLDPGFIKIDVEGVEHLVFEGAQNILSENRPIILAELSDYLLKRNGSSALQVINFIKKYQYDVIDPIHPNLPVGKEEFGNILCLPK